MSHGPMSHDPIPVRMLSEFVYCPRLFYLMHVEGLMEANADVWQGRYRHAGRDKVTDRKSRRSGDGEGDGDGESELPEPWREATALSLGSESLGLVGKLDTVLVSGQTAIPVELKKGKAPTEEQRPYCWGDLWLSDAIQLGAQALLLKEEGYRVPRVEAYYATSRKLVAEPFLAALAERVRTELGRARDCQAGGAIPPPLEDSPKCHRCSLNVVCLPEESALLDTGTADYLADPDGDEPPARRVIPARIEESILVVEATAATVRKRGEALSVEVPAAIAERDGLPRTTRVGFDALHEVVLVGSIQITAQTMMELLARGVPVTYLTRSGRLLGTVRGGLGNNVRLRIEQHRLCRDELGRLPAARVMVRSKIRNQRTFLRRNDHEVPDAVLGEMATLADEAVKAGAIDTLMGLEGRAARLYFERFGALVASRTGGELTMDGRNRRPPRDPVNALLSFGYAVLTKDVETIVHRVGFDPLVGFLHSPGYGRPALALDLVEEFRSLIVDSTVLRMLAQSQAGAEDFLRRPGQVIMKPPLRKRYIRALEGRKKELVTHPVFGYRISYARTIDVQARVLARWVLGEAPEYLPFETR